MERENEPQGQGKKRLTLRRAAIPLAEAVGSRVVVTGASSGIGRCFAEKLAPLAEELVVVARDRARLEALASELESAHRCRVTVEVADLSSEADCRRLAASLEANTPDLLINNAGYGTRGPFAELPIEEEIREVSTNVLAPMRLLRACLPGMLERNSGAVIQVSSLASELSAPFAATYGATKAFLTHFTESVYEELRESDVRIQALLPGFTRTEFQRRAGVEASKVPDFAWMSPDAVVAASLASLCRDEAVCIPGRRYKALHGLTRFIPRGPLRKGLALKRFR